MTLILTFSEFGTSLGYIASSRIVKAICRNPVSNVYLCTYTHTHAHIYVSVN